MSDGLVILLGKIDIINLFHKQFRCFLRKDQDENVHIQYDFNFRAREKVLVTQLCPTLCDLMDCSPPGSSVHGDSQGKNTGVGCHALLQGIFQPRDWTRVSCIAGRFFSPWVTREIQYKEYNKKKCT